MTAELTDRQLGDSTDLGQKAKKDFCCVKRKKVVSFKILTWQRTIRLLPVQTDDHERKTRADQELMKKYFFRTNVLVGYGSFSNLHTWVAVAEG